MNSIARLFTLRCEEAKCECQSHVDAYRLHFCALKECITDMYLEKPPTITYRASSITHLLRPMHYHPLSGHLSSPGLPP
jgi:hypothetical protein